MTYEHGVVAGAPVDALLGGDYTVNLTLQTQAALAKVHRRPIVIRNARWVTTSRPEEVDRAPRPSYCHEGCTCDEGRQAAKAFLAQHPGYAVIIGVVTFDFG